MPLQDPRTIIAAFLYGCFYLLDHLGKISKTMLRCFFQLWQSFQDIFDSHVKHVSDLARAVDRNSCYVHTSKKHRSVGIKQGVVFSMIPVAGCELNTFAIEICVCFRPCQKGQATKCMFHETVLLRWDSCTFACNQLQASHHVATCFCVTSGKPLPGRSVIAIIGHFTAHPTSPVWHFLGAQVFALIERLKDKGVTSWNLADLHQVRAPARHASYLQSFTQFPGDVTHQHQE
mmetsp:Transcript_59894/g.118781  ORF Transcript_59894/g.118781 Transcript_59894/m.118781 type:complete len:232 (-) Transcript_59894:330-1025(-)